MLPGRFIVIDFEKKLFLASTPPSSELASLGGGKREKELGNLRGTAAAEKEEWKGAGRNQATSVMGRACDDMTRTGWVGVAL